MATPLTTTSLPSPAPLWTGDKPPVAGKDIPPNETAATPLTGAQLAQLLGTLPAGNGAGVIKADGAPVLERSTMPLTEDDFAAFLRVWTGKNQDAQLATAKQGVKTSQIKKEQVSEAQMKKLEEWIEKCNEAKNQSLASKIFGWIGKIVATIAAAVFVAVAAGATGLTGGLSSPLMAVAVMALVGASISLADQISKECGGPEISISNLVVTMVGKTLEAMGVDADTAERIGKIAAGAMAILMPAVLVVDPSLLGTLATGIAELAGADANTVALAGMIVGMATALTVGIVSGVVTGGASSANTIVKVATTITGATSAIVQGSLSVAKGANDLKVAGLDRDAQHARAESEKMAAVAVKLQAEMEDGMEQMKKIIQAIDDAMQQVSQTINGMFDSKAQITANLGKRTQV